MNSIVVGSHSYGAGYDLAARRKNATRESTATLKAWLNEHKKNPYPTKGEKIMLAIITKMTLTQVSTWFANARRRLKKENKMTWEPKNKTDDDDDAILSDDDDQKSTSGKDDIGSRKGNSRSNVIHACTFRVAILQGVSQTTHTTRQDKSRTACISQNVDTNPCRHAEGTLQFHANSAQTNPGPVSVSLTLFLALRAISVNLCVNT